ncbi:AcrR family transcriptional regulator [Microbacterium endophyticum]|uniref:AcrR family transcriptional regulator n=1 Tax=Microbacterium endophyticum TaxID=1526412 RepID=A0A7W4YLJ6_9MICO|nr:TetR/AcrR family transcriptional regulator [Microbacterium endophyticum]MBB2975505.1 AcrR family transcriptional regulator [Microbacterium endophyticum]NIK35476.1 AcrR family transcriptional regulator [Microbacterium endophyticum]
MRTSTLSAAVVIERGAALADENGFSALTLAEVARSLKIQAPSLYTHVESLDALRDGIAILALRELSERITDAIMGRSSTSALTGFADAHRDYARERPGCWESLQRPQNERVARADAARRLVQATNAVLHGYGITAPADHVHATRIMGSAINGFVHLERVGSFSYSEPDADSTWPELIDALDTILRTWATRATEQMEEIS